MKTKYSFRESEATLHLTRGNAKLGRSILSFATIPGNADHRPLVMNRNGQKEIITNIIGTCSKYCSGCAKGGACYAFHDCAYHHNVCAKAWSDNTLLLRSGKVFKMIDEALTNNPDYKNIKLFRINTAGEIENADQLVSWNELAKKHPNISFSLYTKNYDALEEFLKTTKETADNFVINVSQWKGVADKFLESHKNQFNVFEYDGSNRKNETYTTTERERLSKLVHCPAIDKHGNHVSTKEGKPITCAMCKKCYKKTGETTAVFAH